MNPGVRSVKVLKNFELELEFDNREHGIFPWNPILITLFTNH